MQTGVEAALFTTTQPRLATADRADNHLSANENLEALAAPQDSVAISPEAEGQFRESKEQGTNLTDRIREFEEHFKDENRVPPSIYNQMKKLLAAALEKQHDKKVDKSA